MFHGLAAFGGTLLVGIAAVFADGDKAAGESVEDAVVASSATICSWCSWNSTGTAHYGAPQGWGVQGLIHISEVAGSCPAHDHIACLEEDDDAELLEVQNAIEDGDVYRLARAYETSPAGRYELDAERSLLKIIGCNDVVIAVHVLPSLLLESLNAQLAN